MWRGCGAKANGQELPLRAMEVFEVRLQKRLYNRFDVLKAMDGRS